MDKRISLQEAVSMIKDGMTIMVGGFLSAGSPLDILDALAKSDVKDLTLISNDTAYQGIGVGNLIGAHKIKKLYVSHIGTNPDTAAQMNAMRLEPTHLVKAGDTPPKIIQVSSPKVMNTV